MSASLRTGAKPTPDVIELSRASASDRQTLRIAHYTGYPRVSRGQRELTAIVREAKSELALFASEPERIGALLRLEVGDLHGAPTRETLARVVACTARPDGTFEVRVESVVPHRARFARRASEAVRLEG